MRHFDCARRINSGDLENHNDVAPQRASPCFPLQPSRIEEPQRSTQRAAPTGHLIGEPRIGRLLGQPAIVYEVTEDQTNAMMCMSLGGKSKRIEFRVLEIDAQTRRFSLQGRQVRLTIPRNELIGVGG